jgi:hypothetical protein
MEHAAKVERRVGAVDESVAADQSRSGHCSWFNRVLLLSATSRCRHAATGYDHYKAVTRQWDPELRRFIQQFGEPEFSGIGVFIGDNEVLTCACAAGWPPIGRIGPSLSDYLLDPTDEAPLPTGWWVQWRVWQRRAYPILVMPKGYSVVVLRVEGLTVNRFLKIASARPQTGASVWVVGDRDPQNVVRKLVVQTSEQRHKRTFFRQGNRMELTLWLTTLAFPPQTQSSTQLSKPQPSDAPFFLEGAPVLNARKELCGVLHGTSRRNDGQGYYWVMEPLSEVKEVIEAALQR